MKEIIKYASAQQGNLQTKVELLEDIRNIPKAEAFETFTVQLFFSKSCGCASSAHRSPAQITLFVKYRILKWLSLSVATPFHNYSKSFKCTFLHMFLTYILVHIIRLPLKRIYFWLSSNFNNCTNPQKCLRR